MDPEVPWLAQVGEVKATNPLGLTVPFVASDRSVRSHARSPVRSVLSLLVVRPG